jgi:hypothetical protein
MRASKLNQRGAGAIGCLLMIAVVASAIYAGLQFGLPELRHRSFEERLNETFGYFSRQPEETIRKRIIMIASEFNIDLKPEMVKIKIEGSRLTIDIDYEKVIDLKVQQRVVSYHSHRSGPY